jgi:hypothetical protein
VQPITIKQYPDEGSDYQYEILTVHSTRQGPEISRPSDGGYGAGGGRWYTPVSSELCRELAKAFTQAADQADEYDIPARPWWVTEATG